MHSSPLPSTLSFVLRDIIINTSSPHIVHKTTAKRAHAFHSIYIVLHSANIVIQYIGWGFHIGFGLGFVYIGMYQYHPSAGLQIQDTFFVLLRMDNCAYLSIVRLQVWY
jgi:hypothetical protein